MFTNISFIDFESVTEPVFLVDIVFGRLACYGGFTNISFIDFGNVTEPVFVVDVVFGRLACYGGKKKYLRKSVVRFTKGL